MDFITQLTLKNRLLHFLLVCISLCLIGFSAFYSYSQYQNYHQELHRDLVSIAHLTETNIDGALVNSADWISREIIGQLATGVAHETKYKADVVKEFGELPEVFCCLPQINQVILNLLVNAAQAIDSRGTITLCTGVEGDQVWIDVKDTGKGIADVNLKRIFEPFFTTKPVGEVTGLELSLSYAIIRDHGGEIEVHSEPGVGTRFRVWLPLNSEAPVS